MRSRGPRPARSEWTRLALKYSQMICVTQAAARGALKDALAADSGLPLHSNKPTSGAVTVIATRRVDAVCALRNAFQILSA